MSEATERYIPTEEEKAEQRARDERYVRESAMGLAVKCLRHTDTADQIVGRARVFLAFLKERDNG